MNRILFAQLALLCVAFCPLYAQTLLNNPRAYPQIGFSRSSSGGLDGLIGVASLNGAYSTQSIPGDVVFRTEPTTNAIFLQNGSGSPALSVLSNRVGIGNRSPSYMLDVNGSFRQTGGDFLIDGNNTVGGKLKIIQNGNVGIGMNADLPEALLHLNGSFRQSSVGEFNVDAPYTVGGRLRILQNGNVGIGTTNPGSYKLAVEGMIGARQVKVTAAPWADFVFRKGYRLRPLSEVEAYIKANGHLPDVPSEAQIAKEGNDLGNTDAMLLQKIEELTLYLLEQQKKIDSLTQEIKQLKEKNR
jgi:hypothetical protein